MKFYVRTSYFNQEPDLEEFDSMDEAGEAFQDAVDQRRQFGNLGGDVCRITTGYLRQDGTLDVRGSVFFS